MIVFWTYPFAGYVWHRMFNEFKAGVEHSPNAFYEYANQCPDT